MNIYDSIMDSVEDNGLSVTERGQFYTAVLEYLYFGRLPNFKMTKTVAFAFEAMKPVFDNQRASSVNGKKGGRPKKNQNQGFSENDENQKPTLSEKGRFSKSKQEQEQEDKETVTNVTSKKAGFSKPTVDEVSAYIAEKGWDLDAEKFWHHYESNGWKVGRSPMKSWKSALVTWRKSPYRKQDANDGDLAKEFEDYDF